MPLRLLASNCSSPDPLSQSSGPTISSTPQIKRSPKKRRTTIISTPSKVTTTTTSSPWRFRVVVEAERDVDEGDDVDVTLSRGRKTQTRTTTTKIPLRGLSPEPARTGRGKKKTTPARPRAGSRSPSKTAARKSPTAKKTPAPKKTPRARRKAAPVMPAEGEEYGRDEEEGEEEEETPTPQIQEEVEKPVETSKRPPRKSRSPTKSRAASARTSRNNAIAGPSRAAAAEEEESVLGNRSALSRVDPNTLLSPTPPIIESSKPPTRRTTRNISSVPSPSPPPAELDTEDEEASIEQSEGFSLISAHSLLPDFRDSSLRHHQTLPTQDEEEEEESGADTDVDMALPDFTYIDTGASYTPRVAKKQGLPIEPPEGELFDGEAVGVESFYGAPIPPGLFRSSPPPEFSREISSRDMITPHIPGAEKTPQLPPRLPDGDSGKKRTRETPGLDSILRAGEDLRSSMGTDSSPGMEMRSERFGGALDNDDEDDRVVLVEESSPSARVGKGGSFSGEAIKYPRIEETASAKTATGIASPSASEESTKRADRKGKGKAKATEKRRRSDTDDVEWDQAKAAKIVCLNRSPAKSPSKSVRFQPGERTRTLGDIWDQEREAVRKQAEEVGAIMIDASPSRTVLLEEKWQEEREEVKRQAQDAGAITIDTTIWEQAGTDEPSSSLAGTRTLGDIWDQEREAVRKAEEGAIMIDASPSRTVLLEEKWEEEREEVKRQAQDAGAIAIDTTIWEQAGTDESSLSLAGQDTKAFEESIYNRIRIDEEAAPEKLFPASAINKSRTGPSSSAGSSSSTGRKYGIGSSTIGIRGESVSSRSSPPPTVPTTMYQPSTREQAVAQISADTTATRPAAAAPNASNTSNMLPPDLIQPSAPAPDPEPSGWTQNHWKLLETILHSRKTVPPVSWKRRLLVSIDDPLKLSADGLLEDDDIEIVQSREGMWLRLSTRETYAVARFLRKKQVKTEGWEEKAVAGKVGAIVLAAVRRRRREERRVGKELRV